jgi:hypothetical protein
MRTTKIYVALAILAAMAGMVFAIKNARAATRSLAVGPQYDTTHVYVAPEDFDRFVESLIGTFGGTKPPGAVINITPVPSETMWQAVFTPVGTFSVFGFRTPIPYPFGSERTGYLVSDFDAAIDSAKANHADIVVAPFQDPIGRDAIVAWPGGVSMQLYWQDGAKLWRATNCSGKPGLRITGSCRRLCAGLWRLCGCEGGFRRPKRVRHRNRKAQRCVSPHQDRLVVWKNCRARD